MIYLLILTGVVFAFLLLKFLLQWALQQRLNSLKAQDQATSSLISCTTCGTHVPVGEAIFVQNLPYCCLEHLPTEVKNHQRQSPSHPQQFD